MIEWTMDWASFAWGATGMFITIVVMTAVGVGSKA